MLYTDISYYRRRLLEGRWSNMKSQHGVDNLDPNWFLPNGEGKKNFCVWLESLYMALPDNVKWSQYCLERKDETKPWLADNCELITIKEQIARKPRKKIPDEKIEEIKQLVKANPHLTLFKRAKIHNVSIGTVSKVMRFNKAGIFKKGLQ